QTVSYVYPRIYQYLEAGDFSRNLSVFQSYKRTFSTDYELHFSTMRYHAESNLLFCLDFKVDHMGPSVDAYHKAMTTASHREKLVPLYDALTDREKEITHLIAEGLTNAEIGSRLFISPNTIRTHRNNIYRRLGVKNLKEVIDFVGVVG